MTSKLTSGRETVNEHVSQNYCHANLSTLVGWMTWQKIICDYCVDVQNIQVWQSPSISRADSCGIEEKGRRIEEEFPEVVAEIERILLLNGDAAHKDRHIDHNQFFGTSMKVLVEHLLATLPLLAKSHPNLAPTTLAHLFIPPNLALLLAMPKSGLPVSCSLITPRRFTPLWQQTQCFYWSCCCE